MGDQSAIEWTEATWNCLVGCTRVSAGCVNCYAERLVHRGLSAQHRGLTKIVNGTPHWTGEVRLVEAALDLPLRWKKPRRIFVNSLSDLFHEAAPDDWIDRIFGVMARAWWHTFQVLTKRPERMRAILSRPWRTRVRSASGAWPLPNVWLGVSVEDQATADERIPLLLQTPAAVRWVSYEPALGLVDFKPRPRPAMCLLEHPHDGPCQRDGLGWIVVGGESGPGARPFNIDWARQTVAQGRAAGVPVFVKQLGSQPRGWCSWRDHDERPPVWLDTDGVLPSVSGQPPHDLCHALDDSWWSCSPRLHDRKGGDPAEWPEDLRVREYPR